ncbi:MAG: patatin-like phospholipase family protein [Burkholderiaceae bacterium]
MADLSSPTYSLALQGGDFLGVFGWGFLEQLLASGRTSLEAVCGSDTGAINAALLADGLAEGGAAAARQRLGAFWQGQGDAISLEQRLRDSIDFERLRGHSPVQLLVCATRVRDGGLRIFRNHEISVEVLLASCSRPLEHPPVSIDGELYWDGGYGISLPLRQLAMESRADDVLVLQQGPHSGAAVPAEGLAQLRQLSRNGLRGAWQRELEVIQAMMEICRADGLRQSQRSRKLQRLRIHPVAIDSALACCADEAALWQDPAMQARLREDGQTAAEQWLRQLGAGRGGPQSPLLQPPPLLPQSPLGRAAPRAFAS